MADSLWDYLPSKILLVFCENKEKFVPNKRHIIQFGEFILEESIKNKHQKVIGNFIERK